MSIAHAAYEHACQHNSTRPAARGHAVQACREAHLCNLPLVGCAVTVQGKGGTAIAPVLVRQRQARPIGHLLRHRMLSAATTHVERHACKEWKCITSSFHATAMHSHLPHTMLQRHDGGMHDMSAMSSRAQQSQCCRAAGSAR